MTDPRAGKTYTLTWEEWVAYCAEHGIDPREQCEDGEDLGGGDSFTVACYDKPPKEEAMGEMKICDLCAMDGDETKAIGWYTADDGDDYDVCKKHSIEAKKAGFEVELHEEG